MTGPIDCTVVIPVFNRGDALAAGIESLRAQTLAPERIEIIYVDDGSNDGRTPKMIDQIVANTSNARVFHEPASGSPGRPRNVGLANALGGFVFFADHDDWFDPHALERLVEFAEHNSSDIVIGKVVAHGRRTVIPRIFRRTRASVPAPEAMISLTPHKLFRRDFLLQHEIWAPEGRRRLEDHHFVTHAYLHAQTISVYADHVCYHHNDPGDEGNFSRSAIDLDVYVRSNREVMALIRRHTHDDPALRDAMLERPVLHELLKKAGSRRMRTADAESEARKHQMLRAALVEDVPDSVVDRFGAYPRAIAKALREDDPAAVRRVDDRAAALSLRGELVELRATGAEWALSYRVVLEHSGTPVAFRSVPGTDQWRLDDEALSAEDADRPERPDDLLAIDLEVLVTSRRSSVQWHLPTSYVVTMHQTTVGGPFRRKASDATLSIAGTATLNLKAVGDAQIGSGIWDVQLRAEVLGVDLRTRLSVIDESALPNPLPEAKLRNPPARDWAFVTEARRSLAIEVSRSGRR